MQKFDVRKMYAEHSHLASLDHFVRLYGDPRSTFSEQHLGDLVQLNVLVAPFSVVLVLAFAPAAYRNGAFRDPFVRFVSVLTGCAWTCLLFWIPGFPMQVDWDRFSLFVLPTTVLAFLLIVASGALRPLRSRILLLLVAFVHAALWIWTGHTFGS